MRTFIKLDSFNDSSAVPCNVLLVYPYSGTGQKYVAKHYLTGYAAVY